MTVSYCFYFNKAKVFMNGDEGSESMCLSVYADDYTPGIYVTLNSKDAEKLGAALFHMARTTEASQ